jgi:hypothetical protein
MRQVLESERAAAKAAPAPAPGAAAAAAAPAAPAASALGASVISVGTRAEDASVPDANKARIEVYGQVMLDGIYDFDRMNPDWNATLRPSQIPVGCPGSAGCGKDGAWIFSARQSNLGARLRCRLHRLEPAARPDRLVPHGG